MAVSMAACGSSSSGSDAGAVMAVIPMLILYLIFQKQFVEGIATSGGKL
jgi:multiple sugar transport system permease protein